MIRKIKALGLAVIAVLAFGALSATAASAAEFHSEVAHFNLVASQHAGEDTWTFNAGTVKCKEVTYSGTQTVATTSTVTLTPTYRECSAFGFIGSTVDTNGCGFFIHAPAGTINPMTGSGAATKTTECPEGAAVVITSPGICEVKIGAQGPSGGITLTNTGAHAGSGRDVTIDVNTTVIKYTQVNKGFCANGSFTNGTRVGSITLQGKTTAGAAVGLWVH